MKQPLDRLRSRKKPVAVPYWIALDSELADELSKLQEEARKARMMADMQPKNLELNAKADECEAAVEELLPRAREASAKFVCKSIGRRAFEDLQNGCPATPDQQKEAKKAGLGSLAFNPDTFPPAVLLAAVYYVDPDAEGEEEVLVPLDDDFVKELWEGVDEDGEPKWNHAEVMDMFQTAYEANTQRRVIDLGNASRQMRG